MPVYFAAELPVVVYAIRNRRLHGSIGMSVSDEREFLSCRHNVRSGRERRADRFVQIVWREHGLAVNHRRDETREFEILIECSRNGHANLSERLFNLRGG